MTQPSRINTYTPVKAPNSSGVSTATISVVVGAGSNRYSLLLVVWNAASTRTISSITRDGQNYSALSNTLYTSALAGTEGIQFWGLANPNAGTNNATVTWSGVTVDHYIAGATLQDVASTEGGTGYSTQTTAPIVLTSTVATSSEKVQYGGVLMADAAAVLSGVSPTTEIDAQDLTGALTGAACAGFFERIFTGASQTLGINAAGNVYDATSIVLVGTAGDVTLALTGTSSTSAIGSLGSAVSKELTGNSATSAIGDVTDNVSYALTGVSATSSIDSLVSDVSKALIGEESTASIGDVSAVNDVTIALTGTEATASIETLTCDVSYAVTGVESTSNIGAFVTTVTTALQGEAATADVGSVSADGSITIALTGVSATASIGDTVTSIDIALLGSMVSADTGNVVVENPDIFIPVSGGGNTKRLNIPRNRQINVEDYEEKIPQQVKEVVVEIVEKVTEDKQEQALRKRLRQLDIEFKQEYIEALKDELIREYMLVVQDKQRQEEETIVFMMMALV